MFNLSPFSDHGYSHRIVALLNRTRALSSDAWFKDPKVPKAGFSTYAVHF